MLQKDDLKLIEKKGISPETLELQLTNFRQGFPFIKLVRPAKMSDGITPISKEKKQEFIRSYEQRAGSLRVIKFVPASGAASRMFKHLFEFRQILLSGIGIPANYDTDRDVNSVYTFFQNIQRFAFYNGLKDSLDKQGKDFGQILNQKDFVPVLDHLLSGVGLNYSSLPKALLAFHNYEDGPRSALEEHLVEAALYTKDSTGISRIHFTVSPEHIQKFDEKVDSVKEKYEARYHTRLEIGHSIQKSSTDTIAVDENNEPFRNSDGTLLFRPAGHGALLANLKEQDADIIFIKNIDNVVPDRLKSPTIEYKKLIGGFLLFIRERIYEFLGKAESGNITTEDIQEMVSLSVSYNLVSLPAEFAVEPVEKQCGILARELNRPIRVCGMVRNEGEPGGGPFWVSGPDGTTSLQIVESSQVNMKDERQREIFGGSTHFNPVDLVCCTIDYRGNPFNLQNFVDRSTGFISRKTSEGHILKAQELPGLWNGSMAGWITVFIEVPLSTFNPVKTINDLLRDDHQ